MSKEQRRKAKKARKRLLQGSAALTPTQIEYLKYFGASGVGLTPELLINATDRIRFRDVQEMVLWVLGETVNPKWFCIRHKPMVTRLALIVVNKLRDPHLMSLPESSPLAASTRLPIALPASRYQEQAVLQALLLYGNASRKSLAAYHRARSDDSEPESKKAKRDLPPASHYVLSQAQLADNQYPATVRDSLWREVPSDPSLESERLLAIDCEMCTTTQGLELARVSVVDQTLTVVYDALVLPANPIVDYNTEYSGISKETLQGVTTRLSDVQERLLEIIGADRPILVGHSLENDLLALKLVYDRVIDTAILYPHRQAPFKCSLRYLAQRHLKETIQKGSHDSCIDARVAMSLALLKIERGPAFGLPSGAGANAIPLFGMLSKQERKIAMIDDAVFLKDFATGSVSAIHRTGDGVDQTISALDQHELVVSRWQFDPEGDQDRRDLLAGLERLHNSIPPHSLVVVVSGGGLSAEHQRLLNVRVEHIRSKTPWSDANDLLLRQASTCSESGIVLFSLTSPGAGNGAPDQP